MSFASVPCFVWWFVAGAFAGWLLWWLIDRLFLRNNKSAELLASLETEVQTAKSAQEKYAAEIATHKTSLTGVQNQLSAAQGKLGESTQQLQQFAELEKSYEAEYAKVVADRDGLKQQLTDTAGRLRSEHESADTQLAAAYKEADTLKTRLSAAKAEAEGYVSQIRKLQHDLALAENTNKAAHNQLEAEHKGVASLQGRIPVLEAEIGKLKNELASAHAAQHHFTKLQSEWTVKERAYQASEAQVAELKTALSSNNGVADQLAQLKAQLTAAQADNDRISKASEAEITKLKSALAATAGAGQQSADLRAELMSARAEAERATKELHVTQDWLTRTGTELEGARTAHAASNSEVARLQGEIASLNVQIGNYDKLRKALEAARQAADIGLDFGKKS